MLDDNVTTTTAAAAIPSSTDCVQRLPERAYFHFCQRDHRGILIAVNDATT